MRICRHELHLLSGISWGWSLGLAAIMGVFLLLFPVFQTSSTNISELFSRFPGTVRDLFGIKNFDLRHLAGYYPFVLKVCAEFAGIGALIMGATAMNREVQGKTADFLLSRPVTRGKIFREKVKAVFLSTLKVGVVFLIVCSAMFFVNDDGTVGLLTFMLASLTVPLIMILYNAGGILLGVYFPRFRGVTGVAIGSLFGFHILFEMSQLALGADNIVARLLIPVCLFDRDAIVAGSYEPQYLIWWAALIAIFIWQALRRYRTFDFT